jgi:hypothetical protein
VTTVASQYAPVTTRGEIVSFLLMLYAVLVFTYFMSSLASALIGGDQQGGRQGQQGDGHAHSAPSVSDAAAVAAGHLLTASGAPAPNIASADDGRTIRLTAREIDVLRAILQQVDGADHPATAVGQPET